MRRRQCLRDSDCKSTDIANWSLHRFGRCIEKENNVKSYFSMLSGIPRFVAPLYEIASGHKYRAGSCRSARYTEWVWDREDETTWRDTTRYDAIRFDTMRPGTKEGFQCRRSSFEGTRNFLHSKHSCEKFRARKSWQILRVAFYPPPLCSLSIQFVLYFHPLFLPLCRPFFSMFPSYANERIRDSTEDDFRERFHVSPSLLWTCSASSIKRA